MSLLTLLFISLSLLYVPADLVTDCVHTVVWIEGRRSCTGADARKQLSLGNIVI